MTPQEVVETKDQDFHDATKTWEITWSEERLSEHNPEYVRKDAFVEKTWDWIEDNLLSSNQQDKSRLYFEHFKKYMEK